METVLQERSRLRGMVRLLAVLAILAAGYAGMQLAPIVHTATTSISSHSLLVDSCPPGNGHC